jgi:hypothetical protein
MLRALLGLAGFGLLFISTASAAEKEAIINDMPVDKEAVNKAIDRGVAYLKQSQRQDGCWQWGTVKLPVLPPGTPFVQSHPTSETQYLGATCLAGLALLEADVPALDPVVQRALDYVRNGVPDLTFTHSLGAAILFLDRVGDEKDIGIIKTLAARLLAGQHRDGGWGYQCPKIAIAEVRGWTSADKFQAGIAQPRLVSRESNIIGSENSTAEFAVMGLWVARRHQVPVMGALSKFEMFCRTMQSVDGTFPYMPVDRNTPPESPCTTCAGLVGLAYAHGAANESALLKYAKTKKGQEPKPGKGLRDLDKDPALRQGFAALEKHIRMDTPVQTAPIRVPGSPGRPGKYPWTPESRFVYMALWAIERVGVAYDREKIGKIDWYHWGARKLLEQQEKVGSWKSRSGDQEILSTSTNVDTAWALLFLRRSNPAPDLFMLLKGIQPPPKGASFSPTPEK